MSDKLVENWRKLIGKLLDLEESSNMNDSKRKEQSKLSFDYQAEREYYTIPIREIRAYDWLDSDLRTWIPGYPDLFKEKQILDIGAGEALHGILICERHHPAAYTAIDLIWHRLLGASTRLATLPAFSLCCGDCYDIPFSANAFDIVLGNGVLHHLPNLSSVMAQVKRVLRPGGIYLGREPNFGNPLVRRRVLGGHRSQNEHAINKQELASSFIDAGFDARINYFWRRAPWLRHPILSTSVAIYATRV